VAFGSALRQAVNRDPARFDRIAILSETIPPLTDAARAAIRSCRGAG
jgi:fructose-bisphosphate aldolase class II